MAIFAAPPYYRGGDPETRWKLSKPLYGLSAARKECCLTIRGFPVNLGAKVTWLDMSVFFRDEYDVAYGFGRCAWRNCVGDDESGVFEINENFGPKEKRNADGGAISHVGDLLISCTAGFILFYLGSWERNFS